MPRLLCIIPAKGGSTRLRRKNIQPLAGKSLLQWAADAGRASGLVQRIVVSTEDEEIAEAARGLGLDVPFMRPPELARDPAGIVDVCLHVLDELEARGERYDELLILPPTCPLRSAEDVSAAYALFKEKNAKFLMSVSAYEHTPFAALKLAEDGTLDFYFPQYIGKQSQAMPVAYRPNGAIHLLDVPAFRAARSYFAQPLVAYVMPRERSVDIDHQEDLLLAEIVLNASKKAGG